MRRSLTTFRMHGKPDCGTSTTTTLAQSQKGRGSRPQSNLPWCRAPIRALVPQPGRTGGQDTAAPVRGAASPRCAGVRTRTAARMRQPGQAVAHLVSVPRNKALPGIALIVVHGNGLFPEQQRRRMGQSSFASRAMGLARIDFTPTYRQPPTARGIYSAGVGVAGRDPDHGRVVIGAGVAGVSR